MGAFENEPPLKKLKLTLPSSVTSRGSKTSDKVKFLEYMKPTRNESIYSQNLIDS